jgi:putative ABC transport system permease protein
MLRHYLSLALRHVARNRLYALISVTGLAIGFCAATLIGLYIHDELTYDHWLPNSDRIYEISTAANGRITGGGPSDLGLWVRADYPEFEAVVTLAVAVASVLVQAWATAGVKPVEALRYQ